MSDPLELLRARYGADHIPASASRYAPDAINPVLETLLAHRSVRGFRKDALPAGTLELLIAAAQSAPSSSNLQTFSVVSLEEPERKSRVATLAADQEFIREAPLFLAWLADLSRLQHIADAGQVEAEGLQYLDTFLMGAIDAALAAQNVVTAAESLGLGTVYVGALRNQPLEVARELGLPQGVFPLFGLAVGVPDAARPASVKPRLPQELVLHREQYNTAPVDAGIARYDTLIADFNRSQGLPPARWTERTLERVRSVSALRGRDKLREQLGVQGFELK
ncbi:NADPH-dependent oxidoreductase [Uliginosibacterium sp. H3]|uniref:NADPH-dependent oxidoreductase n=1 Tax=Uliginosibacterium silvisoli TaxID=3114758 RepID=A0ABU6K7K3_9RHOO|nr:NADPH-dependent oxidoreductase [Uliginosibacterium sp. H3]